MSDQPPDPGRRQSSILEELERKVDKLLELPPRIELAISQRVPALPIFTDPYMVNLLRQGDREGSYGFSQINNLWRSQVATLGPGYNGVLQGDFRTVDPRTVELTFTDPSGIRGSTYRFVLYATS